MQNNERAQAELPVRIEAETTKLRDEVAIRKIARACLAIAKIRLTANAKEGDNAKK